MLQAHCCHGAGCRLTLFRLASDQLLVLLPTLVHLPHAQVLQARTAAREQGEREREPWQQAARMEAEATEVQKETKVRGRWIMRPAGRGCGFAAAFLHHNSGLPCLEPWQQAARREAEATEVQRGAKVRDVRGWRSVAASGLMPQQRV